MRSSEAEQARIQYRDRLRFESDYWALRLYAEDLRLHLIAKYAPDQPRWPAGNGVISGRWSGGAGTARPHDDGRIRVAQNGPINRGLYFGARSAIVNGRLVETTPGRAVEIYGAEIDRDMAEARVRERGAPYRRPAGLYETPEGYLRQLRADAQAADRAAVNLDRMNRGLPPLSEETYLANPVRPRGAPDPDAPTIDILQRAMRPEFRYGRSGPNVYTVPRSMFEEIVGGLTYRTPVLPAPARYKGAWFSRGDQCVIGLRYSDDHGPTIDVIRHGLFEVLNDIKIHQR